MKKVGRNDPCPCGSGKKFKKCCEASMLGGRFKASLVDAASAPKIASASRLTGLFKAQVSNIAVPTGDYKSMPAISKGAPEVAAPEISAESADKIPPSEEGLEQKKDI